jgi:hypothetical protein
LTGPHADSIIGALPFLGFDDLRVNLQSSLVRIIVATICVLAALWVMGSIALYGVMRQSPEQFGRVMAKIAGPVPFLVFPFETLWMRARAGTLQVGSPAPDFFLSRVDKTSSVQLSALTARSRPVVLVFGSYT